MKTKEEILNKHVSLYFSSHHDKSRWNGEGKNGGAEWHTDKAIADDIYKAMDEYAKISVIKFDKWQTDKGYINAWGDTWVKSDDGSTVANSIEELYQMFVNQFIEKQNK